MTHDHTLKIWHHYTQDIKKLKTNIHTPDTSHLPKTIKSNHTYQPNNFMIKNELHKTIIPFIDTDHKKPSLFYQSPVKLKRPHIDSRLDLHGLTQQQAYQKICQFIQFNFEQQRRSILIITGKGQRIQNNLEISPVGALRQMLPQWLETPVLRGYIIHYSLAKPQDGGVGAFYIKLKKIVK